MALTLVRRAMGTQTRTCRVKAACSEFTRAASPEVQPTLESLWHTAEHQQLTELREKHFGRDNTQKKNFSNAVRGLVEELGKMGGLEQFPQALAVHPIVLKITEIDELNQVAKVGGLMLMKWYEPSLARSDPGRLADVPLNKVRLPSFPRISSAIEQTVTKPTSVTHQRVDSDPAGVVYAVWEWSALVEVTFDLWHFPFDDQKVSVVFWFNTCGMFNDPDYGRFVIPYACGEAKGNPSAVQPLRAIAAEWRLFAPTLSVWNQSERWGSLACRKQGMMLDIPILRRSGFYVNMMHVMGAIATLCFCAFAAQPSQIGERLSSTFSLLLALIAFKFSVADKLPKVAYLTKFDQYMHTTFVFLGLLAIYFALIKAMADRDAKAKERVGEVEKPEALTPAPMPPLAPKDAADKDDEDETKQNELLQAIPEWVFEPSEFERWLVLPLLLTAWLGYNLYLVRRYNKRIIDAETKMGREIQPFHIWRQKPRKAHVPRMPRL